MKAYLHLGPEKTGTSYLQCLCVTNRVTLLDEGIFFPHGTRHDECSMRRGKISAGNGRTLARSIDTGNWRSVAGWISRAVAQAHQTGADRLLLSSEQLLAPLSRNDHWSRFLQILASNGIASTSILLVQRDPVEQLLSLYKHRAKSGSAGRIQQWVDDGYTLPNDLKPLRAQAETGRITLYVRSYSRQPGRIEELFFKDWLGLKTLAPAKISEVNPSLTLSELELLRQVRARRPELVAFLYEQLAAVAPKEKIENNTLKAHARAVAENAVWHHRKEWQAWNQLMPKGEQLIIPAQAPELPRLPEELGFTIRQIEGLSAFMAETARFPFLARLVWRSRLRPFLGRIKRLVAL